MTSSQDEKGATRLADIERRMRAKRPHGEDCPDDAFLVNCGDVNYLIRVAADRADLRWELALWRRTTEGRK